MMTELREYLTEAEAIVSEWYSRDGLEPSHEHNFDQSRYNHSYSLLSLI